VDRGTPFQLSATLTNGFPVRFGPVRAGQRWIIEHFSSRMVGRPAFTVGSFKLAKDGIAAAEEDFISQQVSSGYYYTNSQTKFIVEPGATVFVRPLIGTAIPGNFVMDALISGVIVPAP